MPAGLRMQFSVLSTQYSVSLGILWQRVIMQGESVNTCELHVRLFLNRLLTIHWHLVRSKFHGILRW